VIRLFPSDNPVITPSHEESKALQALQAVLARDADRAKVSRDAIAGITTQQVPAACTGFVRSIEKPFGERVQFVRAD